MKKLLIVDDEKIEREGIKMLLKQMNLDLDILEANNGKKAYQILSEREVDLMLTDIKMPFMSGMDLVKAAKEMKPDMPIAIFSGFGEFTYAQEAIRYGVKNYILKPVKPDEFKETIQNMLVDCQKREEQEEEKLKNNDFQYKYFLQKYLFTGKTSYINEIMKGGNFPVNKKEGFENIQNMMLLDTENHFFEEHGSQLVEELVSMMGRRIDYMDINPQQMLLIFYRSATDNYLRIAKVINELILNKYGVKCYISVSRKLHSPEEYPKAYQELETQIENKFYHLNQMIFSCEAEDEQNAQSNQRVDYQKKIQENIKLKDIASLWDNFEKLKKQIREESMDSQMYVKFIFSELVKDLYDEMQATGSVKMKEIVESIYRAGNVDTICKITEECIQEFEQKCMQTENGVRSDIDQVKQYIAYHVDEDLSIDKLAAKVYLSQGYLSYIFKKETGMNLSRYIKQCRMEKAKEMLKGTNMKIVQICEKVGFSNVSYFCQSFREYCGVSPERYRKGESGDEELD